MKLRSLLLIIVFCFIGTANAQFWSESFDPVPSGATAWSMVNPFGANGLDPNFWTVSDAEGGVAPAPCPAGQGVAGNGNNTMHITSVFFPAGGAAYDAGGLCGILFCPETAVRTESPMISSIGQTNLTLDFDYIANGGGGPDFATVWYNDGGGWTILVANLIDPTPICGSGQGLWHNFSIALPASCDNIANLQIGFGWQNNDDGAGTDPSVAINDVSISAVAAGCDATITQAGPFCVDAPPVNLVAAQGGGNWTGTGITNGALGTFDPATAGAGSHIITYTLGCGDVDTETIVVNPLPTIVANATATTICSGDPVTLTGSGGATYTWTGGVTDGVSFNPPATATYTVTGTDANGCINTDAITVTVNNCSQPTASFTADSLTICVGGDILFTDNSTGTGITAWTWDFDVTGIGGATPATANTQGPHNVTFSIPGSYSINLSVTDANGTDDTTIIVTVTTCTNINAGFTTSSNSICATDSIVFTDATTGGTPTIWQWDFDVTGIGGATPSTAINIGPHTVFYNTPGTYTVELIVFDGTVFDTITSTITVTDCSPTANFSASNTTLCETDCITFTDLSTGTPTSYSWSFPGGTPLTATGANPGSICYAAAGSYDVTLTVTNQYGVDSIVMTNLITVNLCTAPTAGIATDDADNEICTNNCIDFTYDGGAGGTPTTLTWTFPGGTPSSFNSTNANDTITVCWNDTSGTFNVGLSVSNANGSSTANTDVIVHLEPIINAGLDTSITIGTDGFLNATVTDTAGNPVTGGGFSWTPSSNLTDPNNQGTTVTQPLETTTYTVTYTDSVGCIVTDQVIINVDIALNIGVPSAFSPNGDGSNDFLLVRGKIVIQTMNFAIYNRYGQKVFETTDVDQGWDGTHNGNEINPGVFVYYVNVTFIDGSSGELKGNVTLVR